MRGQFGDGAARCETFDKGDRASPKVYIVQLQRGRHIVVPKSWHRILIITRSIIRIKGYVGLFVDWRQAFL
jgi:hypothetical protein